MNPKSTLTFLATIGALVMTAVVGSISAYVIGWITALITVDYFPIVFTMILVAIWIVLSPWKQIAKTQTTLEYQLTDDAPVFFRKIFIYVRQIVAVLITAGVIYALGYLGSTTDTIVMAVAFGITFSAVLAVEMAILWIVRYQYGITNA